MICALDQLRQHRSEDSAAVAAAAIRSLTTFITLAILTPGLQADDQMPLSTDHQL